MPGPGIYINPNPPPGSTPNCVAVKWDAPVAPGEDIDGYTVTRKQPGNDFQDVAENRNAFMCGLEPDTPATFKVCAVYVSEEEDPVTGCSSADLRTTKAGIGEMEPQAPRGPLPVPPIKPIQNPGLTEFGVEWGWKGTNDGHNYDYYNITITPDGGEKRFMKHDDDGNWGWQLITNLTPGTTYSVMVEGCDIDPIPYTNDDCSGWSPAANVTTALPYGPDTCASGFVWRDAVPGDHICVTPDRRQKVADDLNTANTRAPAPSPGGLMPTSDECNPLFYTGPRNQFGAPDPPLPGCRFSGQKQCLDGFVPRDVPRENVIVCVDQKEADLLKQENANPTANRVNP